MKEFVRKLARIVRCHFLLAIVLMVSSCENRTAQDAEYSIAYNVLVDSKSSNYDVFVMNVDGTEKTNITLDRTGVEWTYMSEGKTLYFISDKDTCKRCYFLYKTNAKGESPTKVSDIRLADSWMTTRKDGTEILVVPHPKVDSAFYLLDLQGKLIRRIETGRKSSFDPLFVNDGKQIVFRGGRVNQSTELKNVEELYRIDDDGKNLTQLTSYPVGDTTAGKYGYKAGAPRLHPTEGFVSYQSQQAGKYSLYAISLDGKRQWKLTNETQDEGWHDWSPDGKLLAVELYDTAEKRFSIALIDWKSKSKTVLTDSAYHQVFAPNFVQK